jgi:hypothetical protein
MNVLPVFERELHAQARHAFNYLRQAALSDSPPMLAGELPIVFALIGVGRLFRNLARRKFALA